jgi:hypothetical protein
VVFIVKLTIIGRFEPILHQNFVYFSHKVTEQWTKNNFREIAFFTVDQQYKNLNIFQPASLNFF